MKRLRGTSPGHCARVDFFDRQRANELCDAMEQEAQANGIALYILTSSTHAHTGQRYITTDHAIELRNRKSEQLCLFIPSDLVDAAFSSLANSFAPIDGGDIQREAIQQLYSSLTPDAQSAVRSVLPCSKRHCMYRSKANLHSMPRCRTRPRAATCTNWHRFYGRLA